MQPVTVTLPECTVAVVTTIGLVVSLAACTARVTPDTSVTGTPRGASGVAQGTPEAPTGDGAIPAPVSASAATATARIAARLPHLERVIGGVGTEPGQLMLPVDVAVDQDGNLFVADSAGVQKLAPDGQFILRVGADELKTAQGGLALAPDERLLYVTGFEPKVWVFNTSDGSLARTIGQPGSAPGQLSQPVDVTTDNAGNLYVADAGNARVEKFAPDGTHLLSLGGYGQERGQFSNPRAVAVDGAGRIYVGQGDDFLIQRFNPDGSYLDAFGEAHADENAWRVGGVALDDAGNAYVTQALSGHIQDFGAPDMRVAWEYGQVGPEEDAFSSPLGITVVADQLYVADQSNHRIKVYRLQP
jgi:tripartite motif-containing protein 71